MTFNEKKILDDLPVIDGEPIRLTTPLIAGSTTTMMSKDQQQQQQQPAAEKNEPNNNNNNTTRRIDITQPVQDDEKHLVKPAGVGGAILGLLIGGPILCALLGFGSAYAVRKPKDTIAGDTARSLGEITLTVGEKVSKVEEKHKFGKRTVHAINNVCGDNNINDNDTNKRDSNKSKNLAFKTRALLVSSWLAATKYTQEKQLIERGVEGTGKGIEQVDGAIKRIFRKLNPKNCSSGMDYNANREKEEEVSGGDYHLVKNSNENEISNAEYMKFVIATTN